MRRPGDKTLAKAVQMLRDHGYTVVAPEHPVAYGCHIHLEADEEPDRCVYDTGEEEYCDLTRRYERKELCPYWRPVTPEGLKRAREEWTRKQNDGAPSNSEDAG